MRHHRDGWRLALAAAIVFLSVLVYVLVPGSTVAPVLSGQGGSSVDLEGETTVIFFVTPGCPACKSMYEDINELSRRGIRVIAAGVGYEKKTDMEFFSLVQKIVLDEASEERYGLWAYPTIVFVGRDGTLMYRTTGTTSGFGMWWRLALTDALGV